MSDQANDNAARWLVVEFDAKNRPIWTHGPMTEAEARERFEYVTRKRHQRSDVVIRARSAALLERGQVVEATTVRRSRRAPHVGNKALTHLDVESREQIVLLELKATRLGWASLRRDGTPRIGPSWRMARRVACEILNLVRGSSSKGGVPGCWWLVEWDCHDTQAEREQAALHGTCPYHDAPVLHGPVYVEGW